MNWSGAEPLENSDPTAGRSVRVMNGPQQAAPRDTRLIQIRAVKRFPRNRELSFNSWHWSAHDLRYLPPFQLMILCGGPRDRNLSSEFRS